jgi:hypothetical protein
LKWRYPKRSKVLLIRCELIKWRCGKAKEICFLSRTEFVNFSLRCCEHVSESLLSPACFNLSLVSLLLSQ